MLPHITRSRGRIGVAAALVTITTLFLAGTGILSPTTATAAGPTTYTNPLTSGSLHDFSDPTAVLSKDGTWYAYATTGLAAKSTDLVTWQAQSSWASSLPGWVTSGTMLWAPDVRYINGKYVLYYSVTDSNYAPGPWDSAIGVATADDPAGPWTHKSSPLIPAEVLPSGAYKANIDPAGFTDINGRRYVYYGSVPGGIWVQELNNEGTAKVGSPTKLAGDRFEGAYVVRHDGWYYLFLSDGSCCAGETSGYGVWVARSQSPTGPFLDAEGRSLLDSRVGGTNVMHITGNKWLGGGHNTVLTDASGQDWMLYHGINRTNLANGRSLMIDRIDWIDGWPTVRGGAGASDGSVPAPVAVPAVYDGFESPSATSGAFTVAQGSYTHKPVDAYSDGGRFLDLQNDAILLANAEAPAAVRVSLDVRVSPEAPIAGVIAARTSAGKSVTAVVDAVARKLRVTSTLGSSPQILEASIPGNVNMITWHKLVLELRGTSVSASLSDATMSDPTSVVRGTLTVAAPQGAAGIVGVGDVDTFGAGALYTPSTTWNRDIPVVGTVDASTSEEFDSTCTVTWLRPGNSPYGDCQQLVWKTQQTNLATSGATPTLLLASPPTGNWVAETKLTFDVGTSTVRDSQQAGLIVHVSDTSWLRLVHVASGASRYLLFDKHTSSSYGAGHAGSPATTTWLRIARSTNAAGEQLFRAGSSTDGTTWFWGPTWTLPAGSTPKIGLLSEGSTAQAEANYGKATAKFDYLRFATLTGTTS